MTFISDLLSLMPHLLTVVPVTSNNTYGEPVLGTPFTVPCRIEGESRLVRDANTGKEIVSSFMAYCGEFNNLSVDTHRFTLPDDFGLPQDLIEAISVEPWSNETGEIYEVVVLP